MRARSCGLIYPGRSDIKSDTRHFESDHRGEFIERRRYSELASPGFDAEFVVASAKVLYERVTTDYDRRSPVGLEAAHRSQPGFESAVVALDAVVPVLLGVVERVRDQLLDHRLQCLGQVGDHLVGFAVSGQRGLVKNFVCGV